jgi:hypothetical protein
VNTFVDRDWRTRRHGCALTSLTWQRGGAAPRIAEMASVQRFVPLYFTVVQDWLAKRIRGFGASR